MSSAVDYSVPLHSVFKPSETEIGLDMVPISMCPPEPVEKNYSK